MAQSRFQIFREHVCVCVCVCVWTRGSKPVLYGIVEIGDKKGFQPLFVDRHVIA